jgi:hypothetical protein
MMENKKVLRPLAEGLFCLYALFPSAPDDAGDADDSLEPVGLAGVASAPSFLTARLAPEGDLWSVAYHPEPLKTIPTGAMTLRRLFLLHSGQRVKGSSWNDCFWSNRIPQLSQRYV